jgi:hypothetical protein
MDKPTIIRLRLLGILVLILFFMFALPVHGSLSLNGDAYQSALAATLAFGIALLLLAEIAPLIKSLKVGGVEIELIDSISSKFNEIGTRLTLLELAASRPERTIQDVQALPHERAPALDRRQRRRDDQWKGRFGGMAAREGFELTAEFRNAGKSFVEILLRVTAPDGADKELESVEFYLHETFDPAMVPALFHDEEAELSILAYGGFTVGAWIPRLGIELELDLAEMPNAPRIIREL